jgi:hypothetical protein
MWEDGEDSGILTDYDNCEVIEISMPLVKFKQPSNEDRFRLAPPRVMSVG